ncbi:hypothetical protein GW17_00060944 [Ensete ventricosum]|nr:hypothetical protein GW17_00060944 [Ensete ventricosum]
MGWLSSRNLDRTRKRLVFIHVLNSQKIQIVTEQEKGSISDCSGSARRQERKVLFLHS